MHEPHTPAEGVHAALEQREVVRAHRSPAVSARPPKLVNGSYDPKDVDTALRDTSNLDDTKKVTGRVLGRRPASEFPPGHWALLGQAYSRKRRHSVDTDVKMFFTMGNALLDASISSWKAKYDHDFWRPTSAIRNLYAREEYLLARPQGLRPGRRQGQWRALPGPRCRHPAVPRVHLRALDLQRRRPHHPHRLHRQRHLQRAGDHQEGAESLFEPGRSRPVTWSSSGGASSTPPTRPACRAAMAASTSRAATATAGPPGRTIGYWTYDRAKSYWEAGL